MFRKKIINASSNLKMGLHITTKIKSNGWFTYRDGVSISFRL